jgi:hypothetical protein
MEHKGQNFGVDLFKLWEVAAIDIPAFAERTVQAADNLVGIESADVGGGPGTHRIISAWVQGSATLRQLMATSVDNTYQACDALKQIADNYAAADSAAVDGFAALSEYTARRNDETTRHADDGTVFDTPDSRPQIGVRDTGRPTGSGVRAE